MGREDFEKLLRQHFSEKDFNLIILAYRLAKNGHRGKFRDNGVRYFEHVKGTALILLNEAEIFDRDTIIIALLHDINEESFILTNWDIAHIFGNEVSATIPLLTKVSAIEKKAGITKEEKEYIDKIARSDQKTKIVKLADRLHNLRDMESWSAERKQKLADETEEYILPWAEEMSPMLAEKIKAECDKIYDLPYTFELFCDRCQKNYVATITFWLKNEFIEIERYRDARCFLEKTIGRPIKDVVLAIEISKTKNWKRLFSLLGEHKDACELLEKILCAKCNKFYCCSCTKSRSYWTECPQRHFMLPEQKDHNFANSDPP